MRHIAILAIVALTAGCFDEQTVTEQSVELTKEAEAAAQQAKEVGLGRYAEAVKARAEAERKNLEDKAEQAVVESLNK